MYVYFSVKFNGKFWIILICPTAGIRLFRIDETHALLMYGLLCLNRGFREVEEQGEIFFSFEH